MRDKTNSSTKKLLVSAVRKNRQWEIKVSFEGFVCTCRSWRDAEKFCEIVGILQ